MQCGWHIGALKNILRAGYNLHIRTGANINLANLQVVGIGVLLQLGNFTNHHIFHAFGGVYRLLHLKAGHNHAVAQL